MCQVACVRCQVSCNLSHIRKGNSKNHRPTPQSGVMCHLVGVRFQMSGVKCPVFYVMYPVSCFWCHLSGVMCHLFHVRKSNSKSHHCPQVRWHMSLVLCQVSHDRCYASCVRCHMSPVTDPVPFVRCSVSYVTRQLYENAQTEPPIAFQSGISIA